MITAPVEVEGKDVDMHLDVEVDANTGVTEFIFSLYDYEDDRTIARTTKTAQELSEWVNRP
jgi:hypothetical protein